MKWKLKLLFFLMISESAFSMRVLIDPGHGGHDNGAQSQGLREADVTLKIAKRLFKLLDKDKNIQYSTTRTYDKNLELQDRSDKAHQEEADLFISIHANASLNPRARGTEIYIQNILPSDQYSFFLANRENNGEASQRGTRPSLLDKSKYKADVVGIVDDINRNHFIEKSYDLAKVFEKRWKKDMKVRRVRMRQAPFFVVSSVNMPSILLEVGYLTNPKEAKHLNTSWYQQKVAKTIYQALRDYQAKEF
ncbi:MAG: N-acetylmuramoyl-L-alanine amidase [Bdellovibrionota bacterium]|nr:N-acetylmuramoyl-L-alanine amidase [Pseudobdellovibrionaceae bacterium]|tara:strand:+ start:15372 stop:16118 length:747 start_codon:yes stop_codon:yes gene_type:complete